MISVTTPHQGRKAACTWIQALPLEFCLNVYLMNYTYWCGKMSLYWRVKPSFLLSGITFSSWTPQTSSSCSASPGNRRRTTVKIVARASTWRCVRVTSHTDVTSWRHWAHSIAHRFSWISLFTFPMLFFCRATVRTSCESCRFSTHKSSSAARLPCSPSANGAR